MNQLQRKCIKVGTRLIGPGQPIFLTAEIGLAHMGRFEDARRMLKAAADAGCDGADMFMASGEDFYHAPFAPGNDSRKVWAEQSFSMDQWRELLAYADELGLILYPTPLDPVSLRHCAELHVPMINLNSDDIGNILMLEEAAKLGVPVTFHDINASLAEAEAAVRTLLENGCEDIIILHSTQENGDEATLYASANLRVMDTYRSAFGGMGVLTGCVEHTTSDFLVYGVAALAPALISKHIQVAKNDNKHDAHISVEIDQLSNMVRKIRYVEMALGNGHNQKVVDASQSRSLGSRRNKVLVAAKDIPAGKTIGKDDIMAKRPGNMGGLHPWDSRLLLGSKAKKAVPYNSILNLNMFEDFSAVSYKFPDIEPVAVADLGKVRGA